MTFCLTINRRLEFVQIIIVATSLSVGLSSAIISFRRAGRLSPIPWRTVISRRSFRRFTSLSSSLYWITIFEMLILIFKLNCRSFHFFFETAFSLLSKFLLVFVLKFLDASAKTMRFHSILLFVFHLIPVLFILNVSTIFRCFYKLLLFFFCRNCCLFLIFLFLQLSVVLLEVLEHLLSFLRLLLLNFLLVMADLASIC